MTAPQAAVLVIVFVVAFVAMFSFLMKRHIDKWNPHDHP